MIYNDRTRGPENTLKIPVISLNEDFRKRQKKDQGTCVPKRIAFSLLHDSPNDDSISNYHAWSEIYSVIIHV